MKKRNPKSEGEELIGEFFTENDIKFEEEKEILNLKGDKFQKRVADFYLPKYKVYVEFFGQWNVSDFHKNRYKNKKYVYKENNVSCIYLYPDNLGILNFIFKRRLKDVLRSHKNRKKELYKFYFDNFLEKSGISILIIFILIFAVGNFWAYVGSGVLFLGTVYEFFIKEILKN
ncbi:hypothetical protein KAJ87_01385 [Candidatus Pacearchaeota archaeon]|nr:hypothetical protein [Candidatus Pacearchaeota archaeon]